MLRLGGVLAGRGRRRRWGSSTTGWRSGRSSARSGCGGRGSRVATPPSCSPCSRRGAVRSGCSTSTSGSAPTATASAPTPRASPSSASPPSPHGVDLGPLRPRLPEALRTRSGTVELAAGPLLADLPRLRASLDELAGGLVLVGRRQLRSNNSWLHNVEVLVRGPERCTLQIHPDDAAERGLAGGDHARVRSRVGVLEIPVEVTDSIMPGVVSIPHGWGHRGTAMRVAAAHPGVNTNLRRRRAADRPALRQRGAQRGARRGRGGGGRLRAERAVHDLACPAKKGVAGSVMR